MDRGFQNLMDTSTCLLELVVYQFTMSVFLFEILMQGNPKCDKQTNKDSNA